MIQLLGFIGIIGLLMWARGDFGCNAISSRISAEYCKQHEIGKKTLLLKPFSLRGIA